MGFRRLRVLARILLVFLLVAPAAHAAAAFVVPALETCPQECGGGTCPGDATDEEACPPLCVDCSCCCAAHVYLPPNSDGLDRLGRATAFAMPIEGPGVGACEREIFHVPKPSA